MVVSASVHRARLVRRIQVSTVRVRRQRQAPADLLLEGAYGMLPRAFPIRDASVTRDVALDVFDEDEPTWEDAEWQ